MWKDATAFNATTIYQKKQQNYNKPNKRNNIHGETVDGICGSSAGLFPFISFLKTLRNSSLKTFLSDGAAAMTAEKDGNS